MKVGTKFVGENGMELVYLVGKLTNTDREWLRKLTQFIVKLGE